MATTKIAWAEKSWNPVTGCTKASAGCRICYAEKMANRLKLMGQPKYANGFNVTTHPDALLEPLGWGKASLVFVCSMADLFHPDVPDDFIKEVFSVMNSQSRHTFLVLTKRIDRMIMLASELEISDNTWVGVTVESAEYVDRADLLRQVPAKNRFLSCEPLLGSLSGIDLTDIDWVIVGGESGPGALPMNEQWAREMRDLCASRGVPFFYKQKGAKSGKGSSVLDGREWKQMPSLAAQQAAT
jgi:protein gp37